MSPKASSCSVHSQKRAVKNHGPFFVNVPAPGFLTFTVTIAGNNLIRISYLKCPVLLLYSGRISKTLPDLDDGKRVVTFFL